MTYCANHACTSSVPWGCPGGTFGVRWRGDTRRPATSLISSLFSLLSVLCILSIASISSVAVSKVSALQAEIHLSLPAWVSDAVDMDARYPGDEAKVALAIALSKKNVEHGSGGPFGAVIFDGEDRIVSVGVNRVVPQTTSLAHAENMAYMLAQQKLKAPRINSVVQGPVTLATSSQPCCQCYGATFWAGIDRLLIGARAEDVMRLTTFDEGPLPEDWIGCLQKRDVAVATDILRDEACAVLKEYGETGPEY